MSTTSLSGDSVLRQVYDPPTESLKTLITANISGAQEVIINANDDSIKIGDGNGNFVAVNPDGSINVQGTITATNPSVGPTGDPAPVQGTEIAGIDPNGDLHAISVDANGFVNVNGTSTIVGPVTTNEAGLDTFKTSQYDVDTTEVQITPSPLANRSSISLKVVATGSNVIYFAPTSGSVLSTGYPIANGESVQLDLTPSGNIYVIGTAVGQKLYVLELA